MASNRDEFSQPTKNTLAHRVAFFCSNPDCRDITTGPAEDTATKSVRTGDAAHITAAAENGPRYDNKLTPATRKDISNGIWLCTKHARLVDSDHSRYSPALLREWRLRAEERARIAQGNAASLGSGGFFVHRHTLSSSDTESTAKVELHTFVSEFVADIGGAQVFTADDRSIAENYLFEVLLNAHRYEGVRHFEIVSGSASISVEYASSTGYGLQQLASEPTGQGGKDSLDMVTNDTLGRILVNYQSVNNISKWICATVSLGQASDPCAINLHHADAEALEIFKEGCEGCTMVHVHGTLHDHGSDNWITARYVKELVDQGAKVIVHSRPGPMAQHLRRTIVAVLGDQSNFEISEHA